MTSVSELFANLNGDSWRINHPFSEDILQANALLHNSAATEDEMAECLLLWCLKKQPCQFGKVAAKDKRIHFCILREEAVGTWTDEEIAEKIREERHLWKQRAAFDAQRASHSFIIVVASPKVALAGPDQQLRAFSNRMLELAGWERKRKGVRRVNTITSDLLYLKNPHDTRMYGFRFNADFFACAADGRWWQDHRFPGGIAFTANSTGHMMRFREWYGGNDQSEAWALKQAMLTIRNAAPTKGTESSDPATQGRATWLRPLDADGKPLASEVKCPIENMPPLLAENDWTRYEGVLHTDHAVREEFFQERDIAPTASKPYLMDFTYLYAHSEDDFEEFSGGKVVSEEDVYAEIGRPSEWRYRRGDPHRHRSEADTARVAEQLRLCRMWESDSWHVADEL